MESIVTELQAARAHFSVLLHRVRQADGPADPLARYYVGRIDRIDTAIDSMRRLQRAALA